MSLKRKIANGVLANATGFGLIAIAQLVTVPVFVSHWGAAMYGGWVILSTLPAYFAMTDVGFIQAAISDMTMRFAVGNKPGVLRTFQSIFALILAIIGILIVLSVLLIEGLAAYYPFVLENKLPIYLLVLYAYLNLLSRVIHAGFVSTENYAFGTTTLSVLTFSEAITVAATVWQGAGYLGAAAALLSFRAGLTVVLYVILRIKVPWLHLGFAEASIDEIKRLLKPALAAMAVPMTTAFNLQISVLIIGALVSPVAAATFAATRTISRIAVQLVSLINRATVPQLSSRLALGDTAKHQALIHFNILLLVGLLLPTTILFTVVGQQAISLWTRGHIVPSHWIVLFAGVTAACNGIWSFLTNILVATNSHVATNRNLTLVGLLTAPLVVLGALVSGLDGAAAMVAVAEALCAAVVIHGFMRSPISDNLWSDGLRGIFRLKLHTPSDEKAASGEKTNEA